MDEAVEAAIKQQKDTSLFAQVIFRSSRTGEGPNDVQRTCGFEYWDKKFLGNASQEEVLKHPERYFRIRQKYPSSDFWILGQSFSGLPQNFQKQKEYTLRFDLFFWQKE